jgi:hypothetical protein
MLSVVMLNVEAPSGRAFSSLIGGQGFEPSRRCYHWERVKGKKEKIVKDLELSEFLKYFEAYYKTFYKSNVILETTSNRQNNTI